MRTNHYPPLKIMFDFIAGIVLFLILLPLGILLSFMIKLDSKGPVFFKQKRIGKDNVEFLIYKFRTMKKESPKDVPTHLLENPHSHITRVGKFLRKTSLDELPQVLNVLRGEMSLIGPRPALWNQDDLIQLRTEHRIETLRPGVTGWAQVNGRDELSIEEKVRYDLYYKEHLSLGLDIKILLLTVYNVVSHRGVVEGGKKE